MSNGTVSILCTKAGATIDTINYTYNNSGSSTTYDMLAGGKNGGLLYWEGGGFGTGSFVYSVVVDPAVGDAKHAKGDYAEIKLLCTSPTNGELEVHFSMLRGSPGFYTTAIWRHRSVDLAQALGETRDNIYISPTFTWLSTDEARNYQGNNPGATAIGVPTAPVECSLNTSGFRQGQYEDKYKGSALWGTQRTWGWSSVTNTTAGITGGRNIGIWYSLASNEYFNGGPLKPELMDAPMVIMTNGGHYGMGFDGGFADNEVWTKVYGPYFIYCNNVPTSITNASQAANALFNDAKAQSAAEATAWPYSWFVHPDYASAANRGTITGKMVINDSQNPNASAANMWVGVVKQPATSNGAYEFQHWTKPYQFWVQTDANGNFTIPNVIAGTGYTLHAFGPGAAGTFMSQTQTGGNPPQLYNLPAMPFSVTATGGATTALGNITWTPTRVGPTVFEIGYPDRTARKFKHGEDWWVGDIGPTPTSPSPVWTKFLEYPFDFPNGVNYTVGTNRWTTDWNFIQPTVYSATQVWNSSSSTINFNLASAPTSGNQASLYLGTASSFYTALIISVNGTNLGSTSGVTATPSALPGSGYQPSNNSSDGSIRESVNGAFSDERITFPATLLKAGANTITIAQRQVGGTNFADHAMYDYLRLEMTNYVPPAPASVSAFAGNNTALMTWPAVPGATSYKILRSTVNGSGYAQVAAGVTGPVCGSGVTNATYVDTTAANGTTYYYVVQSTNPVGSSTNSAQSTGVTPSAVVANSAPPAPTGLTTTPADKSVTVNWTGSSDANLYTVKRSTLVADGGGGFNNLRTITLANNITGTSYTDNSPTNGSLYAYTVSALNATGGSSDSIASATTKPAAAAPTAGPTTATATALLGANAGRITLNWSAVAGAGGYVIQRSTSLNGTYTLLYTISSLTTTDTGLAANTTYYYRIATMNSGGTSAFVTVNTTTPVAAPTNLVATPGSSKATLNWTASAGATSYVVQRSTTTGGPYTTIASAAAGTSYVDSTALNGVTYYYVVAATGASGTGANSTEASATPAGLTTLLWTGSASSVWNTTAVNWLNGSAATTYSDGTSVNFDDTATNTTVTISGTLAPLSVVFNNSTKTYTLTAATLSGATSLTKLGTGTLNVTGTDTYTGGTTVGGGVVAITGASTNLQNGLGTGPITLQGGTLTMNGYTGSTTPNYGTLSNAINVPDGATGTLQVTQRGAFSGAVTGNGTFTVQVNYVRGDISGDWSAFTGQINVIKGPNGNDFRLNNTNGFGTASIDLGTGVTMYMNVALGATGLTNTIGQLTGIGTLSGGPTAGRTMTWDVGGANTDALFAGPITNGTSLTAITKSGSGTWTLSGACTYTGITTVNEGTLRITGSVSGTTGVTVADGALLDLNAGTLTVNGPITNDGTVRLYGNTTLMSTGVFTNNGVLDLINGPSSLPPNLVNNGTVLDSSSVKVQQAGVSGSDFVVTVQSYAGHNYQLQRNGTLASDTWTNVGAPQAGDGSILTFTVTDGASPTRAFYRVIISP